MGCDFTLWIQVLHNGRWVTIVEFGTKTRCGGFPICAAVRKFVQEGKATGRYKTDIPIIDSKMDESKFILTAAAAPFVSSEVPVPKESTTNVEQSEKEEGNGHEKQEEKQEGKEQKEEEEEEDDEAERDYCAYRFKRSVFFSKVEFEGFLKVLKATTMGHDAEHHLYFDILTPIPMWCNLALTALPLSVGDIWMSDRESEIQTTTALFHTAQAAMVEGAQKRKHDVANALFTKLPIELGNLVADFLAPKATDVRVGLYDDEGQCYNVRHGDLSEPKCCIM